MATQKLSQHFTLSLHAQNGLSGNVLVLDEQPNPTNSRTDLRQISWRRKEEILRQRFVRS